MPNPVVGLLEFYEDKVDVLLVPEIFLTKDSQVEDLLCGAPSCSIASLFFSSDLRLRFNLFSIIFSMTRLKTAALTKLKPVWNDRSISFSSKLRLIRFLVTPIFLYACEKTLRISYNDHVTNEEVCAKAIGPHEDLWTIVERSILNNCGHVSSDHQVWPQPSCKAQ